MGNMHVWLRNLLLMIGLSNYVEIKAGVGPAPLPFAPVTLPTQKIGPAPGQKSDLAPMLPPPVITPSGAKVNSAPLPPPPFASKPSVAVPEKVMPSPAPVIQPPVTVKQPPVSISQPKPQPAQPVVSKPATVKPMPSAPVPVAPQPQPIIQVVQQPVPVYQPYPVVMQQPIVNVQPTTVPGMMPLPPQAGQPMQPAPQLLPKTAPISPPVTPVAPVEKKPAAPLVASASPKSVKSEVQSKEASEDDEKEFGLSTIELEEPQGNWLYKRLWWERAENKYGKVRAVLDEVWGMRSEFFTKRTDLDKTVLDPFYLLVGLGQGELREIVADIIVRLNKSQAAEGDLDQQERALLADLQDEKKVLDDLQKSIDGVMTLDHDVDSALSRLMEQVNRVREYERQAWQSLQDIAKELSDKKAQEIYYQMETVWKNEKGVHKYIQGEFKTHFMSLIKKITDEVNNLKAVVQKLKAKGIDFKDRADKLEEADRLARQKTAEPKVVPQQPVVQPEKEDEPEPQGWVGWLLEIPGGIWGWLMSFFG